jgi:hypothetical protein
VRARAPTLIAPHDAWLNIRHVAPRADCVAKYGQAAEEERVASDDDDDEDDSDED